MSRTHHTFSLLQAVAAIAGLAILLWSLGLPSLRFAEAANLTMVKDTLSDSAPSVVSNHTIQFITPTSTGGVGAGESITITFPGSSFDFNTFLGAEDIDLATTTDYALQNGAAAGATWGVATTSNTITLTSGTSVIGPSATITIEIGLNATFGTNGDTQITNPAGVTSYPINLSVGTGPADTGETRVAIVDTVLVSASVDTVFNFTVSGLGGGNTINGTTTTGTTTATTIPFGQLVAGVASTAAQQLSVETNASNGFVVTVQADGNLNSATGADIDTFSNGTNILSPTAWSAPAPSIGNENTYGHWGVTTADTSTGVGLTDQFGDQQYIAVATSTPVEVFRHNGPADALEPHVGQTQVAYTVQISSLQEAADDYEAVLTYVATPVF
jgi:hypothetical protein